MLQLIAPESVKHLENVDQYLLQCMSHSELLGLWLLGMARNWCCCCCRCWW